MKSRKDEDTDYLKRFKSKSFDELLQELSTEATKLKNTIVKLMKKANNGKD